MRFRVVAAVAVAVLLVAAVGALASGGVTVPTIDDFAALEGRVADLESEVYAEPTAEPSPTETVDPSPSPTATEDPSPEPTETSEPTVEPTVEPTTDPSGFPDATTTGVTDESVLSPSGSITTSHDGQVIENVEVTGAISVEHDNVTIRNVRVLGTSRYGIAVPHSLHTEVSGLLIEDVEVRGISGDRSAGLVHYGKWTARRVDISGYNDGVKMGGDHVLEDSYIHDLYLTATSHNDGIQIQSGSNSVVRGNNVVNDHTQTSAIMLQTNFGSIDSYLIEGNRFSGGGFTMYLTDKGNGYGPPTNVTVRNNVWVQGSWYWGPLRVKNEHPSLVWEGNMFSDGTPYERG